MQGLGVAERGELGGGDDHDLVRADEDAPRPGRPAVRQVEHDGRRRAAQDVDQPVHRRFREVRGAVEGGGRGEQAEIVAALRQEAVDEVRVEAVGREDRLRHALRRILVEVEAGRAEGDVEVHDHRRHRQVPRHGPGRVVGHRGRADAALRPDKGDRAPDGIGAGLGEQLGHGAHHRQRLDGGDHVVAHPPAHQLAVQDHVVHVPYHHHLGSGVAGLRQGVEVAEDGGALDVAFQHDHVRGGRAPVGFERRRRAAHLNLDVGLLHAPVGRGGLHGGGDVRRLAERLDGDAGDGGDHPGELVVGVSHLRPALLRHVLVDLVLVILPVLG